MSPPVHALAALAAVLGELAVPALLEARRLIAVFAQHAHVRQGVGLGLVLFELGQLSSRLRRLPLRISSSVGIRRDPDPGSPGSPPGALVGLLLSKQSTEIESDTLLAVVRVTFTPNYSQKALQSWNFSWFWEGLLPPL